MWENMKIFLKKILPQRCFLFLRKCHYAAVALNFRYFGRPYQPGETSKAKARREKEDFFEKFCRGKGLDIGYGGDLLTPNCIGWDFEHGDAQYLEIIQDSQFDFVYSSHTLEHMVSPRIALKNWWRVIKPGGYLILYLPDVFLYEKKSTLPSSWNLDHKHFFSIDKDISPDTIGVIPLIQRTLLNVEIVDKKVCGEGHTITNPNMHSDGEYSIEVIAQKIK